MCLLPWLMLCACAVAVTSQPHNVTRRESGSGHSKRVVCYYTNWSVYRPGTAKFSPQNINPYLCTHLIYAFGGLTRENSLRPYDKYQDIEQGGYAKFTGLKTYNKQLKTMLAIGGWNEGSTRFSPLVADEERRSELVHNVVRFLRQNHFDGLDLDWEYPAFRDGGKPRDRQNYALLVQELRAEFDRESEKTGRPRLLLTMAVPAGIEYIDKGYDIQKLNRHLDFMNILSYDYHSAFEPAVNHHSPLYPLEEDSEYNFDAQLSIDYTINHYLKLGADRDKLVLGIPTYGRSYTLFNPLATEIGSPADGPGEQGDATREKGYLAYYEICESLQSDEWKVERPNPNAMGPYAYKGNQWVGYDDIDIVKLKSQYVSDNGLGGIMFWAIDNDDFRGKCHGRPYPLIEAGKEAMLASARTSNDVVSVTPSRGSSKTSPKRPSSSSSSSGSGSGRQGPQSGLRTNKKRPSSSRRQNKPVRSSTTTTTTTTTPAQNYPGTTPEPPTTPDPGSDFKCKDEGFFPHPRDCKKYFWCLDSGPSNLGIVAHQFTCPSGLFFNKGADSCDYARNVVCKKKSGETSSSTTKAPPITAATSRTTRISSSTVTARTTSTTTPRPVVDDDEEEYGEDDYEDEEDEGEETNPQDIKELLNIIKNIGVDRLERLLTQQGSEKDSKSDQVPTGFSRSLYDRVLSKGKAGNSAIDGGSPTTPRYTSLYRNRPVKPQNEGLEGLDEVKALRREKPQYVTIQRERHSTPEPQDSEEKEERGEEGGRGREEEEEEEEEDVAFTNDERRKPLGDPVEYVTIRRERPSVLADIVTTTTRYITIQRPRKPSAESNARERDLEVQDDATEIGPVYTGTTERQPEEGIQIVTPIRAAVTEKQGGNLKGRRGEDLERATLEPGLKVSEGGEQLESSISTYPQYVDVTSIGRRRQTTTPGVELDAASISSLNPLPYVEINSVTRRRNTNHDNNITTDKPQISSSFQPLTDSLLAARQPHDVEVSSTGRTRSTNNARISIPEDTPLTTSVPTTPDRNHPKYVDNISRSISSTVRSNYPGVPASVTETSIPTYKHSNWISRRRGSAVRSTGTPPAETLPLQTDNYPNLQINPPPTTPMDLTESTSQGPSVPSTIIPPTSTGFTPTVTRVITSVTESGTTERQRISINRVPYIAIAALRGETSYPGPLLQNGHPTVTADQRLFRPTTTTTTTVSFEHEFITNSSVEQNTIPVTTPTDHTLEKVMEVNRITLVTLKEELPVAYTRALSGNETTERMLVDEQSDKTMDKVSEVSRMKYVTVFGGSQTASPTIDTSRKTFTTLPTASRVPSETQYYENAIDTQGELQSGKPHYYNSTGSFKLGNVSTDSDAEPMVTSVTSKEAESTTIIDDDISSTDKPPTSISPLSNRRRQGSGRKPGVDYFKNRRISTSVSTIVSSTPSTFSHKSRGQRKRPRPYRPTSTTVPEEETVELRSPDDSKVDNRTADTTRNTDPRRTFVPKRGQRRRPRPYVPSSTSAINADEVTNPVDNDGRENIVLVTEIADNATTGFIPKSGNRRRGTTPKPTTDTSKATSMTQIGESVNLKVADKGLKVVDTYDPSDNAESITRVVDAFIPENASRSVPTIGHGNASSPTEPNLKLKTADDIDVSTIKHSQTTESTIISETSPESEFNSESNVKYLSSGLNNAENGTHGNSTGVEETLKPTSLRAYTEESVTPPSTKSSDIASTTTGIWHGDRMRVKKRRRRPVTHILAPPETQTEPKSEEKTPSWNNLQATQNETKFTNSPAETDVSSSNPENNSVVTFATSALLGRDHYEVTSAGSVGDFAATGVREGKHMATPSVVNDPNSIAISLKTQKNKSAAITNTIIVNNVTLHDSSYDFQTSSYDSEQSIIADSDLSTDGSNYDLGRNSIYKPPASEEVHYSVLDSAVEFPNESHTEGTYHEKSEATINTSSRPGHRDFFIPSVDLASEPGDEQSLGSPAATGRVKPGSSSPEGKTRRLVRRKRPKITTEEPLVQSEVVTTTTRNLRRPTGALYNPNRLRQRSTTTTTTTTTTETPVSSTESEKDRRKPGTRLVRRRKYGSSANQTRDSDATASDAQPSDAPTDKDDSRGRVRKYSFPRRRANTTPPPPVTTTPVPVTTLPTNDTPGPGVERGEIQLLESNAQQPKDAEVQEESTTTKLPDLANSAVVAIHNLATVPPTSQASPEIFKSTRTISTTPRFSSTSSSTPATSSPPPRRASKVFPGEQSLPSSSGSASPRRLPDSVSARPRPFSKTTPSAAAAPATSARTSNARPKPTPVIDYEYYDDDDVGILDVAPISGKVKIHSDGYIECLDRGNFPHPFSCKKFISCAKMENGELLGWEYTCPRQLSFDPIGGICNWSAGLGCKE